MTTALRRLPLIARMAVVFILSVAFAFALQAVLGDGSAGVGYAAVTLAQAAVLSENDLQGGVIEVFNQESPVLDRLPIKPIDGNAYAYNKEGTLPGIEFRAVNSAYSESTGTVVQATETLTILGGDADVDTFIQATRSNVNDQRATQDKLKVKAAAYKFQDAFFNGDVAVDANSFDGLKKRLTGGQVIAAGANGLPIVGNGASDIEAFLDVLDAVLAAAKVTGDNGALYMNDLVKAKVLGAARRRTIATTDRETLGTVNKIIDRYRGVPILDPGNKLDGSRILPQTETQGASSVTSSVYAVRFGQDEGDGAVTGLANTNHIGADQLAEGIFAVKDLGEQQAKPALRTRIEGFVGLATFSGTAAARLTGVLAS